MSQTKWDESRIPDQSGKTFIVTGANSGLGWETTKALAQKGGKVIMACRNKEKATKAREEILIEVPQAELKVLPLDLADLDSVRAFAEQFQREESRLDVLINNAGLMALPLRRTAQGFEMQFGVNHLGHFALTQHLLPMLQAGQPSRVVNVSSIAHRFGKINFNDLNWNKRYKKWGAYSQSKLANIHFTKELDRSMQAEGHKVHSYAAHPGYASTKLQTKGSEMTGSRFGKWIMNTGNRLLAQSAYMGALPTLMAATEPDLIPGSLYGPKGLKGHPVLNKLKAFAEDEGVAKRLWDASLELVG